ncbi:hypothetical protein EDD86DRAFT_248355 [Gorgonomyces haynaldii]|nr:hypothetical protein EDD86DRAFT_248355 [Gorgonomyces haynaldii]
MDAKERRELRRQKILERGESRLSQITATYSQSAEVHTPTDNHTLEEKLVEAADAQSTPTVATPSTVKETVKEAVKETSKEQETPEDIPVAKAPVERFLPEKLPSLEFLDESEPQIVSQKEPLDFLGWIHSVIFTLIATIAILYWVYSTGGLHHEKLTPFSVDWYSQVCRNMDSMTHEQIGHRMGPPIKINFAGSTMPVWGMFFTLEMGLLSVRWFFTREKHQIRLPDLVKSQLPSFGINPSWIESVISSVYVYYDMYNFMMNDLYLVLFVMGSIILGSQVLMSLGYCY